MAVVKLRSLALVRFKFPREQGILTPAPSNVTTMEDSIHTASPPPDAEDATSRLLGPNLATSASRQAPGSHGQLATTAMIVTAMFSFAVIGLFISSIGVILPYLQDYYGLDDTKGSLIFLAGPAGYVMAARLNHSIHVRFGQRGIAAMGPSIKLVSALVTALHPPFPLLLLSFAIGGFGYGLLDGSWCAWAGAMERANFVSGLLHGAFSAGAGLGPAMAAQLIEGASVSWYHWYSLLAVVSLVEGIILTYAFRREDSKKYREYERRHMEDTQETKASAIFTYRATWMCAAYLLVDVGTESAISGWIVSFMLRVRHASTSLSSLCSSGFWGGMAVGRVVLGGVTERIGLRRGVVIYLLCAMLLQVLFVLVEGRALSAVLVTSIGFLSGPLFPSCIIQLTRLLPPELHIAAVSYVASIGQVGSAILPFALGALSQWLGLHVFGIVIALQLATCLLLWMALTSPSISRSYSSLGQHEDVVEEHED
ncbi:Bypass of stop codon protein [Paramyrothecium foliicola]|nr:Bypass of stop codon protein [Paramyrothecium foliicola]